MSGIPYKVFLNRFFWSYSEWIIVSVLPETGGSRWNSCYICPILWSPFFYLESLALVFCPEGMIYQDFLDGAREGLKTIASICPTLIGLMTAVGVLRASGLLKYMGDFLGKILSPLGIPGDIVPLALVRLSHPVQQASLLLDIFKEYGTESTTGFMAAIILSATESVFYCMSVYFGMTKVKKLASPFPGALFATWL